MTQYLNNHPICWQVFYCQSLLSLIYFSKQLEPNRTISSAIFVNAMTFFIEECSQAETKQGIFQIEE